MDGRAPSPTSDLDRCSIQHWYPRLRSASIRTTLIPLDAAFVRYLTSDRIFVPDIGDGDDDSAEDDWEEDVEEEEEQGDEEEVIRCTCDLAFQNWGLAVYRSAGSV